MCHASSSTSTLDLKVISERNAIVEKQLEMALLYATDVLGDGNCLFRSFSVCLHGHEHEHMALRKSIGKHMEDEMKDSIQSDKLL